VPIVIVVSVGKCFATLSKLVRRYGYIGHVIEQEVAESIPDAINDMTAAKLRRLSRARPHIPCLNTKVDVRVTSFVKILAKIGT
jgi:hypothetical protein